MRIDKNTKISAILKENMEAVEAIASINHHLIKLKNPFLRKMLAPRVSVAQAAQVGNSSVNEMLLALQKIGFDVEFDNVDSTISETENSKTINMKRTNVVDLDVRPILEGGTDPFNAIMKKLKTLAREETLCIINTFEPIPLLNILKEKGYEFETERPESGEVRTYLTKVSEGKTDESLFKDISAPEITFDILENKFDGKLVEIDVRELEMPMPMVTILEAIEGLEDGQALYVHHKKLPQYLLPELQKRDFGFREKEIGDNDIKLIIFRIK